MGKSTLDLVFVGSLDLMIFFLLQHRTRFMPVVNLSCVLFFQNSFVSKKNKSMFLFIFFFFWSFCSNFFKVKLKNNK